MPTGYTADIIDGISLETFAMNCARQFGACVTLCNEAGGGGQIPQVFEPSDYHLKAMEKAKAEFLELSTLTPEECERRAGQAWDRAETSRLMGAANKRNQCASYEAMLAKVKAWTPPTAEHAGLHEFMREQIEQSIKFDCDGFDQPPTIRLDGPAWVDECRSNCLFKIERHTREYAAEVARAASRTAWIQTLRTSL